MKQTIKMKNFEENGEIMRMLLAVRSDKGKTRAGRPFISLGMWTDGRRITGNLVLDAANPFQHTGLQAEAHSDGPVLKVIVTVLPLVASCPATGD